MQSENISNETKSNVVVEPTLTLNSKSNLTPRLLLQAPGHDSFEEIVELEEYDSSLRLSDRSSRLSCVSTVSAEPYTGCRTKPVHRSPSADSTSRPLLIRLRNNRLVNSLSLIAVPSKSKQSEPDLAFSPASSSGLLTKLTFSANSFASKNKSKKFSFSSLSNTAMGTTTTSTAAVASCSHLSSTAPLLVISPRFSSTRRKSIRKNASYSSLTSSIDKNLHHSSNRTLNVRRASQTSTAIKRSSAVDGSNSSHQMNRLESQESIDDHLLMSSDLPFEQPSSILHSMPPNKSSLIKFGSDYIR